MEAAVQRQHRLRASSAPERQTRAITTNGAQENTAATNSNRPQPCGISLLYSYQHLLLPAKAPSPQSVSYLCNPLVSLLLLLASHLQICQLRVPNSSHQPRSRLPSFSQPIPSACHNESQRKKKRKMKIKKTDTARFNDEGAKMGGERVQQTGVQNEEEPAQPAARKQPCLQGIGIGRLHCAFFFPGSYYTEVPDVIFFSVGRETRPVARACTGIWRLSISVEEDGMMRQL